MEGWILFAAVIVLVARYLGAMIFGELVPNIGHMWLVGYGICCAIYLCVKAIRIQSFA